MTDDTKLEKKALRKFIAGQFKSQAEYCAKVRAHFSDEAHCLKFLESIPNLHSYKTVFGYVELPDEFPCFNLLKALHKSNSMQTGVPLVVGRDMLFKNIDMYKAIDEQLVKGCYGILEPKESLPTLFSCLEKDSLDSQLEKLVGLSPLLVLTPGRAFCRDGRRLGRGGGYYDKFFALLSAASEKKADFEFTAVGLCFPFQLVEKMPAEQTDYRVASVLV